VKTKIKNKVFRLKNITFLNSKKKTQESMEIIFTKIIIVLQ